MRRRFVMKTGPHLHFNGNCREAFDFYARTLNGQVVFAITFGEMPGAADQVPPAARNQIAHIRLDLGETQLFGCDAGEHYGKPQGFNVIAFVDSPAEADRVFRALADNGSVSMPLQETSWAS